MPQNPFDICREADAPASAADREAYATHTPAWMHGIEGTPRPVTPATDSGTLTVMVSVLILIGLNIKHVRRVFSTLPHDLLSVRRRSNMFDEHTANETRVVWLLVAGTCVMQGLLLYLWLGDKSADSARTLPTIAALTALAASFHIFQLTACSTVGYVFTDTVNASLLRRGINAAQVALGVAVTIPTLVSIFHPGLTDAMLITALALYILSRLCYILKGFRIFYKNFSSLLYFILYLCTLEIIPLCAITELAADICVRM